MKQPNFRKGIVIFITFLFIGASILSIGSAQLVKNEINELTKPIVKPLFTRETYMVEMRDGIHLATDVYLPDNISSPHGAILVRTPYNKNGSGMGDWANKGWPSIVQDTRGRFQSEGIDTIFNGRCWS